MERWMKTGAALCAAGMWMAIHAAAQTDLASVAPAAPAAGAAPAVAAPAAAPVDFEKDLCDAVAEGTRLLIENRLHRDERRQIANVGQQRLATRRFAGEQPSG